MRYNLDVLDFDDFSVNKLKYFIKSLLYHYLLP